ncbi:MAG TPA: hypothetical protein VKW76_16610 [Candidatus Binatia bacterium]|nr:hypothetical protein [Candidatus Binatia bacterium]
MRRLGNVGLLLAVGLAARPAGATDLAALLGEVAAAARFPTPARAEVRIVPPRGAPLAAVLAGRRDAVVLEAGDVRALARRGRVVLRAGGRTRRAPAGATLAGTDVGIADLLTFGMLPLRVPQISDEGPMGVMVTGAPAVASPWVLLVYTIEPDGGVVVRTQYYRDTIGNLVRMRRDADPTTVAGHRRPGTITFEDFAAASTTTLTLAWHEAPDLSPALFTPAGLRDAPQAW